MKRLALIFCLLAAPALAGTRALDGNTIEVDGRRLLITGLNAPKTSHPKCLAERMLGKRATIMAENLVLRIRRIDRQGKDRRGRVVARVYLDNGKEWAAAMINLGLAVRFECPGGQCPALTDWCGG